MVIVHGLFGSSTNWRTIARRIEHYTVYCVDLRNHGRSPHTPHMGYARMADDLAQFIDDHQLDGCTVLGHSMGGKCAMALALAQPQLLRALVVVDIAPVAYEHDYEEVLAALETIDPSRVTTRGQADAMLAIHLPDPSLRGFLLQNLIADHGGYAWRINLPAIRANISELIGFPEFPSARQFSGPVCFIHGADSDYVRPAHRPIIERRFPSARILPVADTGHWLHAERPQAFLRTLTTCLS